MVGAAARPQPRTSPASAILDDDLALWQLLSAALTPTARLPLDPLATALPPLPATE